MSNVSEKQQQLSSDKIKNDQQNESQTPSTSTGEHFKKPFLKSLNLMKPSLSLTSLPPQSPKEPVTESSSTERPYNSLKVRFYRTLIELIN